MSFLQVAMSLYERERKELLLFLNASQDETTATGSLRGALWEGLVHTQLAAGCSIQVRAMSKKRVRNKTVEAKDCLVFADYTEVTSFQASPSYCR